MAIQSEWIEITPALAKEYLSRAAPNRPLRMRRIEAYARDMETANWLATGQPVLFNTAGELIDGRHRMQAIVQSGATVTFLVVRGLKSNAVDVVDTGLARTFADTLAIHGEAPGISRTLAALVKRMFLWDKGLYLQAGGSATLVTHTEMDAYLDKHPVLRDRAQFASGRNAHPVGVSASVFASCYTLFSEIDADRALDFCTRWRDGADLSPGSPILQLRERILSRELANDRTRSALWGSELKHALACTAWNIYRENREVSKLQLPRGGITNANYPVPR